MSPPPQRRVLTVCLLVVFVLVCAAVIVGTVSAPAEGTVAFELRKYLIQFLLIVALGAVVAFLVDDMKRRAEHADEARRTEREADDRERQYEIDTVTSLLGRLDAIYRAMKRKRRLLRLVATEDLSKQAYIDAMSKLSEDKEEVEKLWRDIEVLERWLPELARIRPRIKSMEDYLDALEDEWEKVGSTPDDQFQSKSLKALRGFKAKWNAPESTFQRLRDPYYEARSHLIALLANKRADVSG